MRQPSKLDQVGSTPIARSMKNHWTDKRLIEDFIIEAAVIIASQLPISVPDAVRVIHAEIAQTPLTESEIEEIRTNKAGLIKMISEMSEQTKEEFKGLFLNDQDGLF